MVACEKLGVVLIEICCAVCAGHLVRADNGVGGEHSGGREAMVVVARVRWLEATWELWH